ncbi:glycosyltransferase [Acinetobacter tianfuensis]|uniref:Glycosyltransferase n=1 Tax=Acinetobacter tianfuensis TaxID=2419603 RepID=A0A3A8EU78_9GAMM|nr:glycosyltransferase [Acinetobacter tianfuensis]RKG32431.1 glycosyltransferase [Acinetobacter tianfuensis]
MVAELTKTYYENEKLKIVHILYFTEFAGTEKVCVDLCNAMSQNNEVFLLANTYDFQGNKITDYIEDTVNVVDIETDRNRHNIFYLYKIAKILKKINPDVIHCHNTKMLEIMKYCQIFLSKKIPLVFTKHNWFVKKRMKYADICVGISPETLKLCNAKKNILIENGIKFQQPTKILKNDTFNIVGVGRLEEHKNWQLAITALSQIDFDYRLYILGQGVYEQELKDLIEKLNVADKVKLVGFVNNPWDYICSSDLQILPSRLEGFSLALIEGIYYGKMVFALDTANHREVLGDDFIIEDDAEKLAQTLNQVYLNYDEFNEKFSKVKAESARFDINNVAQKYIDAYKSLSDQKVQAA